MEMYWNMTPQLRRVKAKTRLLSMVMSIAAETSWVKLTPTTTNMTILHAIVDGDYYKSEKQWNKFLRRQI